MSETKFNHTFRDKSSGRLDLVRLESPMTPGLADIACTSVRTGRFSWIEMKYIGELPKTVPPKIKFRPGQPQFARARVENGGSAFVFVKVMDSHLWLFKARADVEWVRDISGHLSDEALARLKPTVFKWTPNWEEVVHHFE